jgi:hypothetical protein
MYEGGATSTELYHSCISTRKFTTSRNHVNVHPSRLSGLVQSRHNVHPSRLSGFVQSRHDDTAEVLREFVGRLGFSSSREGPYSRLAPRTPNRPQPRWDFHCNLRPGPGHVLADVSYIHPLAASYLRSTARTPGHAAALRDADKRRDYYADHACPGYAFRAVSFETLGRFSPGTMQFLSEATPAAFP